MRTHYENAAAILGYISLIVVATGVLFKLMHWPGSGAMLILGCSFTAFPFLLMFGITKAMAYPHKIGKVFIMISTFFAMFSMMGIIFKLMRWPGAGPMLILGLFLGPIVAYLPLLIIDIKKSNQKEFLKPGLQFASLILVCLAFAIWGTTPTPNLVQSYKSTALAENNVNQVLSSIVANTKENNQHEQIDNLAGQIIDLVKESKFEILHRAGEDNTQENLDRLENVNSIYNVDVVHVVMLYDVGEHHGTRQAKLLELYLEMEKHWSEKMSSEKYKPNEFKYSRMKYPLFDFEGIPLALAFAKLEAIEQSVLAMQIELNQ